MKNWSMVVCWERPWLGSLQARNLIFSSPFDISPDLTVLSRLTPRTYEFTKKFSKVSKNSLSFWLENFSDLNGTLLKRGSQPLDVIKAKFCSDTALRVKTILNHQHSVKKRHKHSKYGAWQLNKSFHYKDRHTFVGLYKQYVLPRLKLGTSMEYMVAGNIGLLEKSWEERSTWCQGLREQPMRRN